MKSKAVLMNLMKMKNEKVVVMPEKSFTGLKKHYRNLFYFSLAINLLVVFMVMVSSSNNYRYITAHGQTHKELGKQFDQALSLKNEIKKLMENKDKFYKEFYDYVKRNPRAADYYRGYGVPIEVAEKAVVKDPKKKYSTKKRTKRHSPALGRSEGSNQQGVGHNAGQPQGTY